MYMCVCINIHMCVCLYACPCMYYVIYMYKYARAHTHVVMYSCVPHCIRREGVTRHRTPLRWHVGEEPAGARFDWPKLQEELLGWLDTHETGIKILIGESKSSVSGSIDLNCKCWNTNVVEKGFNAWGWGPTSCGAFVCCRGGWWSRMKKLVLKRKKKCRA